MKKKVKFVLENLYWNIWHLTQKNKQIYLSVCRSVAILFVGHVVPPSAPKAPKNTTKVLFKYFTVPSKYPQNTPKVPPEYVQSTLKVPPKHPLSTSKALQKYPQSTPKVTPKVHFYGKVGGNLLQLVIIWKVNGKCSLRNRLGRRRQIKQLIWKRVFVHLTEYKFWEHKESPPSEDKLLIKIKTLLYK